MAKHELQVFSCKGRVWCPFMRWSADGGQRGTPCGSSASGRASPPAPKRRRVHRRVSGKFMMTAFAIIFAA
jgi:hypothetical protein